MYSRSSGIAHSFERHLLKRDVPRCPLPHTALFLVGGITLGASARPLRNYGARPVRNCLNCGNGVRVTMPPPRFRKVPSDEWLDPNSGGNMFLTEQKHYKAHRDEIQRAILGREDE